MNSETVRNRLVIAAHLVGVGHHGHVDVALPADLLLRNDELGGQSILGSRVNYLTVNIRMCTHLRVGDGVVQQTNAPHNLPSFLDIAAESINIL